MNATLGLQIPNIKATGIRAGNSLTQNSNSYKTTIKWAIIIIFIFLAGYWVFKEVLEYYPITQDTFINTDNNKYPEIQIREPRPANNPQSQNTLDLDVLRSHRYYGEKSQPVKNLEESLLTNTSEEKEEEEEKPANDTVNRKPLSKLDTLIQELPTTYMLALLEKVLPLSINFPDTRPFIYLAERQPGKPNYNPQTPIYNWSNLKKLTPEQLTNNPDLRSICDTIKLNLITAINLQVLDERESHPSHPFQPFQIIRSEWLSFISPDEDILGLQQSKTLIATINLVLHRPYKSHTFNIQTRVSITFNPMELLITEVNNQITGQVISLELVGSTVQNRVMGKGYGMGSATISNNDMLGSVMMSDPLDNNNQGAPLTDNTMSDVYPGMDIAMAEPKSPINFDKSRAQAFEEANRKLEAARKGVSISFLERTREDGTVAPDPLSKLTASGKYLPLNYNGDYKCFTVGLDGTIRENVDRGKSALMCQSVDPETGMVGVWDKPCKTDDECPFWKANTNYTNSFGGCQSNGKCQLPSGLEQYQVGYRQFHKAGLSKMECYNCPRDLRTGLPRLDCCLEQQQKINNQASKSVLSSPDYRFTGDDVVRNQPSVIRELQNKGLRVV